MIVNGIQLALRASVAAGLLVALARLCEFEKPIYAIIIAIIITDLCLSRTCKLGLPRWASGWPGRPVSF